MNSKLTVYTYCFVRYLDKPDIDLNLIFSQVDGIDMMSDGGWTSLQMGWSNPMQCTLVYTIQYNAVQWFHKLTKLHYSASSVGLHSSVCSELGIMQ